MKFSSEISNFSDCESVHLFIINNHFFKAVRDILSIKSSVLILNTDLYLGHYEVEKYWNFFQMQIYDKHISIFSY